MATGAVDGVRDAHVVLATDRFDDDFEALTALHGFRVDAIFPADSPTTAIVSAHGVRLRVEASDVDLGPVACLGRGFPGGSTVGPEDPELPGPGKVFFYLVQFHDGTKENSEGELFLVEI